MDTIVKICTITDTFLLKCNNLFKQLKEKKKCLFLRISELQNIYALHYFIILSLKLCLVLLLENAAS